jgi:transcriptional regulator with XRE-family HTH domain
LKGIRRQRKRKGWTMAYLASKLDVIPNTVYRWEAGRQDPDVETLKKMSKLFGCTIDDLVADDDSNPTKSAGAEKTSMVSN